MRLFAGTLAAIAMVAVAPSSNAAMIVLGDDLAHSCYVSAEFNRNAARGIETCSEALLGALSVRDRASTLVNRGILRARLMDMTGAVNDYDAALDTNAKLAEAYLDRSAAMIGLKRYAEALHDANQAVQLGTQRQELAYYNRAIANEALGNIRGAYDDYHAALQVQPAFTPATEQLTRFKAIKSPSSGT